MIEKKIDEMSVEELASELSQYQQETMEKVEGMMKIFGITLGEGRAEWCERVMNEEKYYEKTKA